VDEEIGCGESVGGKKEGVDREDSEGLLLATDTNDRECLCVDSAMGRGEIAKEPSLATLFILAGNAIDTEAKRSDNELMLVRLPPIPLPCFPVS